MSHDSYTDSYLLEILHSVHTIAMVGASDYWNRPSYFAMKYLQEKGYRVIPVNPKVAGRGESILGEKAWAALAQVPGRIDMIDIYRNPEAAGAVVDEALELRTKKGIQVIWMQLGVRNEAAAQRAEEAGLKVVMNRCPKIEWGRLHSELSWGGFNSRVISSRRRRVPGP